MKSNEDNKTLISNILVRNNFLCLKQVYCCLTFVCVYIWQIQVRMSFVHRPFVFPYLSVRRPFCSVLIRCISFVTVTFPLLVRWDPLRIRYLCGRSSVLVRYVSVENSSWEPRAAAVSTFTNGRPTDKVFGRFFIRQTSVLVIRLGVTEP